MTDARRGIATVGVLCAASVLCLIYVFNAWSRQNGPDQMQVVVELDLIVPALAFVAAGLAAWSLRPANRLGLLMMGVGFASLVPADLGFLPAPVGEFAYLVLGSIWLAVLGHMLLAFPGGRIASRFDRILVVSLYSSAPVGGLAQFLVADVPHRGAILTAAYSVFGALMLLGAAQVVRHSLRGTNATRRAMSPVFWSLAPTVVVLLAEPAMALFGALLGGVVDSTVSGRMAALSVASRLLLAAAPVGFLVGLLRTQLDMSAVGDLVVELSGGLVPERLQPALARVLHDPSLEIAYWLPAFGQFTNLEGSPLALPAGHATRAVSLLGDPMNPVAALIYDSSLRRDPQVVDAAAAAVHMALENARLQVQLRAQLDDVRQSRARLVEAADNERRRVERDLHDGAQQQLVTMLLSLQLAKAEARRNSDGAVADLINESIEALKRSLTELRELARGIHPTILTEAGLLPAIRTLADRCPIPTEVTGDVGLGRLQPQFEATLYFVAAEAITNAVKYSGGKRVCVTLNRGSGLASVRVTDDGVGGADMSTGSGLRGLSDRVAAVGGRFQVKSIPKGGTTIHADLPCE